MRVIIAVPAPTARLFGEHKKNKLGGRFGNMGDFKIASIAARPGLF
jgi:hypothetical protein